MIRTIRSTGLVSLLVILAAALSSCVYLLDGSSPTPSGPVTPLTPARPVAPNPGSYTYRCSGGTLVVNYGASQVRVFYDGGFQTLGLVRSDSVLAYTGGAYTWELSSSSGSLSAGGRVVLGNCRL
jgi:membrane-bound inhibitor of C-type lysozyme